MFSWKIFKYPFGRFMCWSIVVGSIFLAVVTVLFGIMVTHLAHTLSVNPADLEGMSPGYFSKYATSFDVFLALFGIGLLIYGVYFSTLYALKRTLFYKYNYIKVHVPFNKVTIKHVLFIVIGELLIDVPVWILSPEPKPGQALLYYLMFLIYRGGMLYVLLNLYMTKIAKIEWLTSKNDA